jgi:hypothetical protein
MKKSIMKNLGSIILSSSLLFFPIQLIAGEDITNNPNYSHIKENRVNNGARGDFKMESEGSLLIEKYTLKKGENPKQYAEKMDMTWCGIFNGNKLEILSLDIDKIGMGSLRAGEQNEVIFNDLKSYLSKKKGYKAIIRKTMEEVSYTEIEEIIDRASKYSK